MPDIVQRCGAGDSLPVGQYPEMTEAVQYGEDDGRRLLYTKHTHEGPLWKIIVYHTMLNLYIIEIKIIIEAIRNVVYMQSNLLFPHGFMFSEILKFPLNRQKFNSLKIFFNFIYCTCHQFS